jgi:uncharacterized protein YndB with AHSA1/START domain
MMEPATVSRFVDAPLASVWKTLMEPHSYPRWVVGARAFRGADDSWPSTGARFYHAVGLGPLQLKDETKLLDREERSRVVLEARARPAGRAEVVLELEPHGDGTRVTMHERAVSGPGSHVPQPLHDALTRRRNREALRRFAQLVAEQRP